MTASLMRAAFFALATTVATAQFVPQLLYYKFNEGAGTTTLNEASPGVGTPTPTLGAGAGFGPGQFGSTALSGAGATGGANFINSGYAMNLNGMSWTLEFWWASAVSTSTLQYFCGSDTSSSAFRVFASGVNANFIVMSGTGLTSLSFPAMPNVGVWNHYAWVFDASVSPATLTGYRNGVFAGSNMQTGAPTLNTGNFIVGGQSTQGGLNGWFDEFRLWSVARTAAEISFAYNAELFNFNQLAVTQSGPGVGDLTITLGNLSPTASEAWTLITFDVSGPVTTGPLLGIRPDAGTWRFFFTTPLTDSNPVHFPIPSSFGGFPNAPFYVPPGGVNSLAGSTLDFVVFLVDPGAFYAGKSNVVRRMFQ